MDITMTVVEYQALANEKFQQQAQIMELERQLEECRHENRCLRAFIENLHLTMAAAKLENLVLKSYITLSADKVKAFVKRLSSVDRFSFLKLFLEWSLPDEFQLEQMKLLNDVMVMPDERTPQVTNNHFVTLTGSDATYNENPKE